MRMGRRVSRRGAVGAKTSQRKDVAERLRMIESFSNQIQVALFDGKISAAERQHLDKWRLSEGMTTSERNNVLKRHGIKDIDAWPQKEPPSQIKQPVALRPGCCVPPAHGMHAALRLELAK